MREAIHALKYSPVASGGPRIGRNVGAGNCQTGRRGAGGDAGGSDTAAPQQICERGFNQARALAEEALHRFEEDASTWQLKLAPTTLLRLRPTESQRGSLRDSAGKTCGAHQRRGRRRGEAKHILLVDDILTTGRNGSRSRAGAGEGGRSLSVGSNAARAQRHGAPDGKRLDAEESDGTLRLARDSRLRYWI